MNPMADEAGKTARSVVDALKMQPLALSLIVINLIFVVAVGWLIHESLGRKDELISELTHKCIELAVKVPPP